MSLGTLYLLMPTMSYTRQAYELLVEQVSRYEPMHSSHTTTQVTRTTQPGSNMTHLFLLQSLVDKKELVPDSLQQILVFLIPPKYITMNWPFQLFWVCFMSHNDSFQNIEWLFTIQWLTTCKSSVYHSPELIWLKNIPGNRWRLRL